MESHDTKNFPWGKVIEVFTYNLDGEIFYITKYHPWEDTQNTPSNFKEYISTQICFHSSLLGCSSSFLDVILLSILTYRNLGRVSSDLVCGIARALNLEEDL